MPERADQCYCLTLPRLRDPLPGWEPWHIRHRPDCPAIHDRDWPIEPEVS